MYLLKVKLAIYYEMVEKSLIFVTSKIITLSHYYTSHWVNSCRFILEMFRETLHLNDDVAEDETTQTLERCDIDEASSLTHHRRHR